MLSHSYLLAVIFISIQGSCGEIVMGQTPDFISVSPGQTITITCTASADVYGYLAWYQQKPQQPPKQLIYAASSRPSGIPDRFVGSGSGNIYTLTITGGTADDEGRYHCMQYAQLPRTFGGGTNVEIKRREDAKPVAFIFRPSEEQINEGTASTVCLVEKFYPGDAKVTWKVDNNPITAGVETSEKTKDKDNTYSLNSILTMSSTEFKKHNVLTCEVTHKTLTSALVTSFKTSECTF